MQMRPSQMLVAELHRASPSATLNKRENTILKNYET